MGEHKWKHKEAVVEPEVVLKADEPEAKVFWTDDLEHCMTCIFFGPALKNGGADGEADLKVAGACRRHPPAIFLLQQPAHPSPIEIGGRRVMSQAQMGFMSQFPPVMPGAGCGKHEPKGARK